MNGGEHARPKLGSRHNFRHPGHAYPIPWELTEGNRVWATAWISVSAATAVFHVCNIRLCRRVCDWISDFCIVAENPLIGPLVRTRSKCVTTQLLVVAIPGVLEWHSLNLHGLAIYTVMMPTFEWRALTWFLWCSCNGMSFYEALKCSAINCGYICLHHHTGIGV